MKKIEFETSKGRFVVIDKNQDWCFGEKFNYFGENKHDAFNIKDIDLCFSFSKCFKLSEITEEEASEIVDYSVLKQKYSSYSFGFSTHSYCYNSAIESIHSLLESKCITDLTNKYIFKL